MKQTLLSFLAGSVITGTIFYFACCRDNPSTQSPKTDKTQNQAQISGEDSACTKWHKIEELSNQYIAEVEAKTKLRAEKNAGFAENIDKEIGEAYMESYRNSLPAGSTNALSMLIDERTLAFYIKYIMDNKLSEVQASFGRYDRTLLTAKGLNDPVLTGQIGKPTDRNMHYTLIFGLKDPTRTRASYTVPFKGAKEFYDDWNQEWP